MLHVCMYVCMLYICMYVCCMYVCSMYVVCIYVCIVYVCMYVCMYCVCMHCVCMYVCMYVCMHTHMYTALCPMHCNNCCPQYKLLIAQATIAVVEDYFHSGSLPSIPDSGSKVCGGLAVIIALLCVHMQSVHIGKTNSTFTIRC